VKEVSVLRIFSYLPNPRIWKATIAARLAGVEVEVRGAAPGELQGWLWDFDARPLTDDDRAGLKDLERAPKMGFREKPLYKTEAFLDAHPFGTVPAAFSPDGKTGVFESNSIMRAVARLGGGGRYCGDPYEASRIDGFLDAGVVFGRDAQLYLFSLSDGSAPAELHGRATAAFAAYVGGIDRALAPDRRFIVGEALSLADICFVAELCLFSNERPRHGLLKQRGLAPVFGEAAQAEFPRAMAHFARLAAHPAFAPDVGPYMEKLARAAAKAA